MYEVYIAVLIGIGLLFSLSKTYPSIAVVCENSGIDIKINNAGAAIYFK